MVERVNCYKITIYDADNKLKETFLKSGETIEEALLQILNEATLNNEYLIKIQEL